MLQEYDDNKPNTATQTFTKTLDEIAKASEHQHRINVEHIITTQSSAVEKKFIHLIKNVPSIPQVRQDILSTVFDKQQDHMASL